MSSTTEVNLSNKKSVHSSRNKMARLLWYWVWLLLFRPTPRPFHAWRRFLLLSFGAKLHSTARVYPRAKIWAPWLLEMHESATLSDDVDCYCVGGICIGAHTTVSQYTYLCGATHDHTHPRFPLVPLPIVIGKSCWIAADVFVAPGVTIADGVVVGARSSVFADLPEWTVCVGSPAKPIKVRKLLNTDTYE
jgi:putative colanic acid biosynthesis acetyltransferase WcaF